MKSDSSESKPVAAAARRCLICGVALLLVGLSPADADTVYDNSVNDLAIRFDPGTLEVGDEIVLAGSARYLTNFSFQFWGTNTANPSAFAGTVEMRVRLYQNDGAPFNGYPTPATSFFDSGWFAAGNPTPGSTLRFTAGTDFPTAGLLIPASNITWSVQFRGMGATDSAGISLYSPPVVGQNYPDYWRNNGSWALMTDVLPMDFAARFEATSGSGSPPTITAQPQNSTNAVGTTATFTVTATGASPLSYHWRRDGTDLQDGTRISGSQSSTLTISNLVFINAGSYSVVVTNAYGSVTSSTAILTVLGSTNTGLYAFTNFAGLPGSCGSADGTGSVARFSSPWAVAVDSSGNVFVGDSLNNTIRKVTAAGVVTTLAGLAGASGTNDGTGSTARFNGPFGLAVDAAGNLFVADQLNHTIRKVTAAGEVTTLAGSAGVWGSSDGTGSAARFYRPIRVAVDSADNVFVADYHNHTIRKVTAAGVVTTLAGSAGSYGSEDGTGSAARFYYPAGVAVDSTGNVFVTDYNNHTIRKVTTAGVVTTLAGSAGTSGSADGVGSAARFKWPSGVAVDSAGSLFVADQNNCRITKGMQTGVCPTITLSPPTLLDGMAGTFYSQSLTASGGGSPYSYAVTAGGLPGGLTLPSSGVLSGIPALPGTNSFTVTATDAYGCTGSQAYTLTIGAPAAGGLVFISSVTGTNQTIPTVCPPYCELAGTWSGSTLKSSAAGLDSTRGGSRFSTSTDAAFSVTPALGTSAGAYYVEVTHGAAASVSTNIIVSISAVGGSGLPVTTDAFQQSKGVNKWQRIGMLVLDGTTTAPTLTFAYSSGTLIPGIRFYADGIRFISTNTVCLGGLAQLTTVNGPLVAGQTFVTVPGVDGTATNVTVYAYDGTNYTTLGQLASGIIADSNSVPTSPLVKGRVIVATQWKDGIESCLATTGPRVGGGASPRIRLSLSVRDSIPANHTIGADGGTGGGNHFVFIKATGTVGGGSTVAPVGGQVLEPGVCWQTVTFNATVDPLYGWFGGGSYFSDTWGVLDAIAFAIDDLTDTGPYAICLDNLRNGPTLIQDFESAANGAVDVMITHPSTSGTTSPYLLSPSPGIVSPNVSVVVNTNSAGGSQSLLVSWQFKDNSAQDWVRALFYGSGTPNPIVDLTQPISIDVLVYPVNPLPAIISAPTNRTVIMGGTTVFNVGANARVSGGSGGCAASYQWRLNGTNLTDNARITGSQTATLTMANLQLADAGSYSVVVGNPAGSVTSASAYLTVFVPPPPVITGISLLAGTCQLSFATVAGQSYAILRSVSRELPYASWTVLGTAIGTGSTSTFTDVSPLPVECYYRIALLDLGIYSLNEVGYINVIAQAGSNWVFNPFNGVTLGSAMPYAPDSAGALVPDQAGTYILYEVWGSEWWDMSDFSPAGFTSLPPNKYFCLSAPTQFTFTLAGEVSNEPTNQPPLIYAQPASAIKLAGDQATFTVSAFGSPLTYQWYKGATALTDGGNISGAATPSLVIANVSAADAASYSVVVSNSFYAQSLASSVATLSVVSPPVSRNMAVGGRVTFLTTATGTGPFIYQWSRNFAPITGATASSLVLTNLQTSDAATYSVAVSCPVGSVNPSGILTVSANNLLLYQTNLIVVRVGEGTQTLAATGNSTFLDQYTTSGAYVNTVTIPDSGPTGVVSSGAAFEDSYLTRSLDGRLLCLAAYGTNVGSGVNVVASSVPRVVVTFNAASAYNQALISTSDYTGVNWRAAATDGTNNFWGAGSGGGTIYLGNSAPRAVVQSTKPNCRAVEVFNGSLFMASASLVGDAKDGIYEFSGLPRTAVSLPAPMISFSSQTNVCDFAINPSSTILYVADDTAGGIGRWEFDGTSLWTNAYVLTNGLAVTRLRDLAVDWSGPSPVLYATTSETNQSGFPGPNRLVTVADTGAASSFATLAVAGPNQIFRGVKFGPVLDSPVIVAQPQSQTVPLGTNVCFTVTASGTAPLNYQWRFNGTSIPGATGSGYCPMVQTNSAGSYSVVVSNGHGAVVSSNAVLTLAYPPTIVVQPQNQRVPQGSNAYFTVSASGTMPLSYQWRFNGGNLGNFSGWWGVKTPTLTVSNVAWWQTGLYSVLITNSYGSALSSNAILTVGSAPVITSQPASQTNNVGATVSFAISASGASPLAYQWRFNGTNLVNDVRVSGATSNVLTILNLRFQDAGSYSVLVTNAYGSVTSALATQTVTCPTIAVSPTTLPGGTIEATYSQTLTAGGGAAPYSFAVTGGGLPGGLSLSAAGVLSGTPSVPGTANFIVTAMDINGCTGSRAYTLVISGISPYVTLHPHSTTNLITSTASFTVGAGGTPPLSYQWRLNGVSLVDNSRISGSQSPNLTIANVQAADEGSYLAVVANPWGATNSQSAVLAVVGPTDAGGYGFTNFVGLPGGLGNADGLGSLARFHYPFAVAVDNGSNVYVADSYNHTIRKVTPEGLVTTLAGSPGVSGSTDGTGGAAHFNYPFGLAVDNGSNLYVADTFNHTIRKVTPAGVVTTLAGQAGNSGTNDGPGSTARFNTPYGVAVDSSGNLYVGDSANNTIRKVTPAGVVTTLAGSPGQAGTNDGTGIVALFNWPAGASVDGAGNLYVADAANNTIRKVTPAGVVTTLAGSPGQAGTNDGTGSAALFSTPFGVTVVGGGNLYVADSYNHTIRQVTPAGVVTTLAGSPGLSGSADATNSAARFNQPSGIAADGGGNVYVADFYNCAVRKLTAAGIVTTLAGSAPNPGSTDGTGIAARFKSPQNVAVDSDGNLYVADRSNHTIRKVTPAGEVTTLAGSPGLAGSADGTNGAARFRSPQGVTVGSDSNLYVADRSNHTIRKVTPAGVVTTLAGSPGVSGSADGTGSTARFNLPSSVAVDSLGNIYVADTANHTIRQVTPVGVVTTLAGSAGSSSGADGTGSAARFNSLQGVAVDRLGIIYVADTANSTIRVVTPGGLVTTLAGSAGNSGTNDGTGSVARFNHPQSLAVDSGGYVYVADTLNSTVRKLTPAAVVTTIGGSPGVAGGVDGVGSAALFVGPSGIAVDAAGILYVADGDDNHISTGVPHILKVAPVLTWTSPAAITYCTALTTSQLNATANVSGSFSYNPPAGAVVDAGTNMLSVVFTPDDTADFSAATGSVALVILPVPLTVTANDASRYYGDTNPVFTGTITGLCNGDSITTNYTCTATPASPPGTYPIIPVLVDPNSRLANYQVNTADGALTVLPAVAPVIAAQPQDRTVAATYNASFSVTLSGGSPPLAYQWRKDGVDLAGANSPTLTLTNLSTSSTGSYDVVVTNFAGRVTSTVATLTVDPAYAFFTFAGLAGVSGTNDGLASAARFNNPVGPAVDSAGNLYVSDFISHTIRKVSPAGVVTTLAGLPGVAGTNDGTGSAARFFQPNHPAVDLNGNVFVPDRASHTIRMITPAGVVTTIAGRPGTYGTNDGTGSAARFNLPGGVAVDSAGNVFVADAWNHIIRKITPNGTNWVVTTIAGRGLTTGTNDGTGSTARFNAPDRIAVDNAGNLFVADFWNRTIRKITPSGTNWTVTTLAGLAGVSGSTDGIGSAARFGVPEGVAADSAGNVFVADYSNGTVRKIAPDRVVTTIAGLPSSPGGTDGTGRAARFSQPQGIGLDSAGNVYISDGSNDYTLRKGRPDFGQPIIILQPQSQAVVAGSNALLTVTAIGQPSLTYQWWKDGVALMDDARIAGAQSNSLAFAGAVLNYAGNYQLVVTNAYGSATSVVATVAVSAPTNIAYLRTLQDPTTYVPTDTTSLFTVRGIVTTHTNLTVAANTEFYLQDESAGIAVYWTGAAGSPHTPPAGALVEVTAPMGQFNGLLELAPMHANSFHRVTVLGTGNPLPTPQPLPFDPATRANIAAMELLEGSYFVASNVWVNLSSGPTFTVIAEPMTNRLGQTFPLFINSHTDIPGRAKPLGPVTIYGVLGQYDTTSPYTGSYQLYPSRYAEFVAQPPVITAQPAGQSVIAGSNVTFTVTASGTLPLTYQWQFNGTNLADGAHFGGATTSALAISQAETGDAGAYSVVIRNAAGYVVSSDALLKVVVPPATITPEIFFLSDALPPSGIYVLLPGADIVFENGFTCRSNVLYSFSTNFPPPPLGTSHSEAMSAQHDVRIATNAEPTFHPVSGPASLVLQAIHVMDLGDTRFFDLELPVFNVAGADLPPDLMLRKSPAHALQGAESIRAVPGGFMVSSFFDVWLEVSLDGGQTWSPNVTTNASRFVLRPGAPFFVSQTQDQTVLAGTNVILSVAAAGAEPLSYRWQKNGLALADDARISGSQCNSLVLAGAKVSDSGSYRLVVTNAYGAATSSVARLDVLKATPVLTWTNPAPITYGVALGSSQLNATASEGGTYDYNPPAGAVLNAGANTLTVVFTPADTADYNSATGQVSLVVSPAPLSLVANNASRPYGQTNPLFTGALTGVVSGDNFTPTYSCSATLTSPPGQYPIIASLLDPGNRLGNYSVSITDGVLTVTCQTITFNPSVLSDAGVGTGYDQTLTASGGASPYNFAVTAGTLPAGLTLSTNGALTGTASAVETNTFTVTATDANGCTGSLAYTLRVAGAAPSITGQPQSTMNVFGSTATFTVSATGTPPLGYQWQFNGTNLVEDSRFSGVTTNHLSISNVQWADAGAAYTVVVTNAFGSVTSDVASLTVTCPLIALTPTNLPSGRIGTAYNQALGATGGTGACTFAVTAGNLPAGIGLSSNGVLSGTPLVISTNSFTVTATDTNSTCFGSRVYVVVILGIPPIITSQPLSLARTVGESATFAVTADGTAPLSYQWLRNGANLAGQTVSTLTLTNLLGANAGSYWVMVTNVYGSATSTVATLTIVKVTPSITWAAPAPMTYGIALGTSQLNASASVAGSFAYTPPAGTYLTVGTSTLRTVFNPADSASYNAATATVSIVVSPGSLTVTANNASRGYGQPNPVFTGTFTGMRVGDGITASYTCSATTNSPLGTYDIVPSLADPLNRLTNYAVTINRGTLTILGATPVITWAATAPITYGTALGSSQLNATANAAGSFTYSPPAGTVLDAGSRSLLAVFTPSDPINYNSATGSVSLAVQRAALSVTANSATRWQGQTNPVFTGTLAGATNNDNITANYTCSATLDSPAGTYPIVPVLFDPGSRLGNYTVTLTNGTLTVNAVNDMFADRAGLSGVTNVVNSSNINASKEDGEPDHAGSGGGRSLWWTWTAPVNGLVTLDTIGSSFDTLLAVYTGNVVSNLAPVAADDESGGNHTSLLSFPAVAGTTYQIAVDGYAGAYGNIVLTLRQDFGPPTFTRQPAGTTVLVGSSVTFSAGLRGSQPFFYQWRKDGANLPGAALVDYPDFTNITFSIVNAQTNNSGNYSLFASNSWGTVISSGARLTVFVRPDNDAYTNATQFFDVANSVTGNNAYATPDGFEVSSFAGRSIWWTWTAPTNGTVVLDTVGSSFDTVVAVYTNGPSGPVLLAWDDQSGSNNWSLVRFDTQSGITYFFGVDGSRWAAAGNTYGTVALNLKVLYLPPQITVQPQPQTVEPGWSVTFSATAIGTTPLSYQWVHDGLQLGGAIGSSYAISSVQPGDAGNYSVTVANAFGETNSVDAALTLYPTPINDLLANSIVLSGTTNAAFGTNVGAAKEPGEPNHAGNSGGRSVWWSWTAPTNGAVILDTVGSTFDTLLAVYTGSSEASLSLVASDNNSGGNLASKLIFSATAGTTYHFAVDGSYPSGAHGAAFGTIALHLHQAPQFAPQITSHPQSQAIVAGTAVTFNVAAIALPNPTYQWLWNGTALAGKTAATLQLSAVTTNQAGAYSVVLTNAAGTLTSALAMLRVEKPLNPGFRGNWPGFLTGAAEDVYATNGLAYVATSAGLLVLDVGNPASPRRIGGYSSDSPATRVAFKDGFVYLLTSSNQLSGATLSRFDARNPALPRKIAQYVSSAASDFALAGDLICAVDGQSLVVLNTNCSRIGTPVAGSGIARTVAANPDYVFVSWPNSIGMYSLANPASPTFNANLGQSAGELALWDSYLYALTGGLRTVQLRVLDLNSLDRPLVGSATVYDTLGVAEQQGLAVSTNTAYVATAGYTGNALGVFDLTQPGSPALMGCSLFADGTPRRLCFADNYVYVANGGAGLKVFDVYNPAQPMPVGQFFTAVEASAVALQGNLAYVLDVNTGFHVVDVSDPGNLFELGAYQSAAGAAAIAAKSHYVYLALDAPPTSITVSGPSLEIIDIAHADQPMQVGSVTLPSPALTVLPQPGDPSVQVTALAVATNLVLVGSGLNGVAALGIVDVSNPAVPRVAGRFDLPGTAEITRIDFDGRYAYLADSYFGLRVLDLADPANPVQVGSFAAASAVSVSVRSNLCLLSGTYGTEVLDVSQPTNPVRVATNSITGTVDWLQNPLALGFGPDGIKVFDLVNLANPLVIGQFVGDYSSVSVQGRYAFAAGNDAGLTVLDLGANFATPPSILDQPTDYRAVAGGTASFYVAANGSVPLSYQWRFNDADIPGATDALLTLTPVQSSQVGQYSVVVANSLGSAVSSNALLIVNLPPTVALASPNDHQAFFPPATIPLVATAADNDGYVTQVAFYQGVNLLAVVTNVGNTNSEFSTNWTGAAPGTHVISAVATDNEGALSVLASASVIVTNDQVIQLSRASYTAYEAKSNVVVTVLRNVGDTAASVGIQTINVTAQAVAGSGIGHYYAVSDQVQFAAGETSKQVPIQLVDDLVYRGQPMFRVMLSNPSSGWSLATPSAATVSILDDDSTATTNSYTDVLPAGPPPAERGSLTVVLETRDAPDANGRWRFEWETIWRLGGSTASNLPPDDYSVVFQERAGYTSPQPNPNTYGVSAGTDEVTTNFYVWEGGAATGSLCVRIHPSALATNVWRVVENPPGEWLASGTNLAHLAPGSLVIEFRDVQGYSTPPSRVVQVAGGQTTIYDVTYLHAPEPASGESPRPLANLAAIANTNTPYQFSGQLLTDAGYSSGFVVRDRTVLTVAHALFDSASLTYANNIWWFFQKEVGEYEPVPQVPRGCYVFEGYAAARTNDYLSGKIGPDESSLPTRQLDVATLYFFEPAGRGGYGGYLTSDPPTTDWLLSGSLMLLIGYPVEGVQLEDRGRMHQVGPGYFLFNRLGTNLSLYSSTALQSYPGNSGGPLCVQAADSLGRSFFLPAGIFLGGSGETIVRSIDLDVVDLIKRADTSAHGGGNSTGGGVITITFSAGSDSLAYLEVHISPPEAILAGAGWRLQGDADTNYYSNTNHLETIRTNDNPVIEFRPVAGWDSPTNRTVSVVPGAQTIIDAVYTRVAQLAVSPAYGFSSSGSAGGPFVLPSLTYTVSNSGETALDWTAASTADWLTLSLAGGTLNGGASASVVASINANANSLVPGSYGGTLSFANLNNSLGNVSYPVNLLVTGAPGSVQLTDLRLLTNGALVMTLEGAPGGIYSIVTSTNLLRPHASWTEVQRVTNSSGRAAFTNPPPATSPFYYRAKELQ